MSLFFDKEKEVPEKPSQEKYVQQGFFSAAGLMLLGFVITVLGFVITVLGWILKPLLSWLFDFRGINQQLATIKVILILVLIGGPLLWIYRIPAVRDALTLSETHTNNIRGRGNYIFPDRSYFVPMGEQKILNREQYDGRTYVTYTGYTKNVALFLESNTCHLVPRGKKIFLASKELPVYAVGFEDEVRYTVVSSVTSLPPRKYFIEHIFHPSYIVTSKRDLDQINMKYDTTTTWDEFRDEWWRIWSFDNGGKPFELQARSDEHALVCF